MAALHYLTVQDILWINLQVTKKVQHFNYARLEEAVFYQYAYGDSNSLLPQAARFAGGFAKLHPFESGNDGTGLVALLAFLKINGYSPTASADEIGRIYRSGAVKAEDISRMASEDHDSHGHGLVPDVRAAVRVILERYGELVGSMADTAVQQTA